VFSNVRTVLALWWNNVGTVLHARTVATACSQRSTRLFAKIVKCKKNGNKNFNTSKSQTRDRWASLRVLSHWASRHPPSPFIIITQPESWYSFYRYHSIDRNGSFSSSIVTMALSCNVFEIKRDMVEKRNFSYTLPLNFHDYLETLSFFQILIQTVRVPKLLCGTKILPKSSTLWVGCTNVTDRRQTDVSCHNANVT